MRQFKGTLDALRWNDSMKKTFRVMTEQLRSMVERYLSWLALMVMMFLVKYFVAQWMRPT
jgi:hypothetical protein